MVVTKCRQKWDKMPSIKWKEDATQSFIQHFIEPSCTAPGLWIGIWSWLDNQKIPSSDKWGFFLSVRGRRVFVFLRASETQREIELKGQGYFHMGHETHREDNPTAHHIDTLTRKYIRHTFRPASMCLAFLRRSTYYRHTKIRLQKLGVNSLQTTTEAEHWGGGNRNMKEACNVELARQTTVSMRQTLSICCTPKWHISQKHVLQVTSLHTNGPQSGQTEYDTNESL